jgi:hypothetical protein
MIFLQLSLVLVFAFILRNMYLYLDEHTSKLGNGHNIILNIIMWVMIGNIVAVTGIFLYKYYQTQWRMIGRTGKQGLDGPVGQQGYAKCRPTESGEKTEC